MKTLISVSFEGVIEDLMKFHLSPNYGEIHSLVNEIGLIIGVSSEMQQLLNTAYKAAKKDVTILIEGETGTGKDLLARFIHKASYLSDSPFVCLNCGALTETLLESELFGHKKGAFTGATNTRKGIFEIADKGTLFLDEIADASPSTQVRLLRVLETGEFRTIGDEDIKNTCTRIIAATNSSLSEAVKRKQFREDLFYRLDVVKLTVPPLRKRKSDIPLLAKSFLQKFNSNLHFSPDAISTLQHHDWPGNIRELINVVERASILVEGERNVISPAYLSDFIINDRITEDEILNEDLEEYLSNWSGYVMNAWNRNDEVHLDELLQKIKQLETKIGKTFVTKMLKETAGNRNETAKRLNITPRKLRYLLNEKNQEKPL